MKAYLAIKFYDDCGNRDLIEKISCSLYSVGFNPIVLVRDYENWGKVKFSSDELMRLTLKAIDESDILVVEFSEKGVGLGIEAGYAYAKNKPIIIIAERGSDVSKTLKGIAKEVYFYDEPEELTEKFKRMEL